MGPGHSCQAIWMAEVGARRRRSTSVHVNFYLCILYACNHIFFPLIKKEFYVLFSHHILLCFWASLKNLYYHICTFSLTYKIFNTLAFNIFTFVFIELTNLKQFIILEVYYVDCLSNKGLVIVLALVCYSLVQNFHASGTLADWRFYINEEALNSWACYYFTSYVRVLVVRYYESQYRLVGDV